MRLSRVFLVVILFAGCVRFVPTREEMNRPYQNDPALEHVGSHAFFRYEREQRERLQFLIDQRTKNIPKNWDSAYRVGPGDELALEVKNFEEISKTYRVQPSGNILLPFVGSLKVSGLKESQVSNLIEKRIEDYVLEPQVHVEVTDYSAHKVWVVGKTITRSNSDRTDSARAFPLKRPDYSLVELLVELGDPSILAGGVIHLYPQGALHKGGAGLQNKTIPGRRTVVKDFDPFYCSPDSQSEDSVNNSNTRALAGSACQTESRAHRLVGLPISKKYNPRARIQIDLEELFGGATDEPLHVPLLPGDAIVLPPSPFVQVYGEVIVRGSYQVAGGSSNDVRQSNVRPSLFSVVSAARGFTYSADIHNVEIYREVEFGKKVVLTVDFEDLVLRGTQDIRLRDGDIVWIPSQSGRFVQEHTINAVNSIIGAGSSVQGTFNADN